MKISFPVFLTMKHNNKEEALLRASLICLRGSRSVTRQVEEYEDDIKFAYLNTYLNQD